MRHAARQPTTLCVRTDEIQHTPTIFPHCLLLSLNVSAEPPIDNAVMVLFEADIAEGALSEVQALMTRMVAFNEPDEPETLVYRAFISEDGKRITFMETYSDTAAMLFHDERFTQHLPMISSG